ncbi:hypothetical protein PISMIDRAFT_350468 [Pisolithus microcarpus 441]|uniref:Secreted protein n=1 Tax=Pisolithus microcarpus 441 TaxID=765257 RepID=A0A0C9YCY7_9AGAM|nr:hypothetical protein PISMIDRAFT_350468 [Pisolithus microcarpus 441]
MCGRVAASGKLLLSLLQVLRIWRPPTKRSSYQLFSAYGDLPSPLLGIPRAVLPICHRPYLTTAKGISLPNTYRHPRRNHRICASAINVGEFMGPFRVVGRP